MRSKHFQRLTRSGAWAFTVLAVQAFCSSGDLWASCSHRTGSASVPISSLYHFNELIVGRTSSYVSGGSTLPPRSQSSPRPGGACSGLSCSSRAPLPASTTFQGPDWSDQWGTLETITILGIRSAPRASDDPTLHPTGHISGVFHPPRV